MELNPRQFKVLTGELKKIRGHLEKLHHSLKEEIGAIRSAQERQEQQRNQLPIPLEIKLEKDQEGKRETESNRQYDLQNSVRKATWATFVATFLAFGAAAVYAWLAHGQLHQMTGATKAAQDAAEVATQQLKLTSQQLEYTQAAKLGLGIEIQSRGKRTGMELMIHMRNIGNETASSVRIFMTVEKGRVKGDHITETDQPVEIVAAYDILANPRQTMLGSYASDTFEDRTPLRLSEQQIQGMRDAEIFIQAAGSVNYFNGFRHVIEPFCFRHITFHPFNPTEDPSFPVGPMVACVVYPRERDDMLRGKRNFEEAKAKQH